MEDNIIVNKKKKKVNVKFIIIGIIIAVLIAVVVGIILYFNSDAYKENKIKKDLKVMTEKFYGYYYDDNNKDNNGSKYVKQFSETGLSITLGDLEIYLEGREGTKPSYATLEKCDRAKTNVIMYPKNPYGKTDVELEYKLECK